MKKNHRSLDVITAEIHKLKCRSIFDIGDLLNEAKAGPAGEHGNWLKWVDNELDMSVDTATRYCGVAKLATKFRTVRNLKVPARTLYELLDDDEKVLPSIIDALAKASTKKYLNSLEAYQIIRFARLSKKHGSLPEAALAAIENLGVNLEIPFGVHVVKSLKNIKPNTEAEAEEIVRSCRENHVANLYKPHGKLPPDLSHEALKLLHFSDPEKRAAALKVIEENPSVIYPCEFESLIGAEIAPDDDDEETDTSPPPSVVESPDADLVLDDALSVILDYAGRATPPTNTRHGFMELTDIRRFLEKWSDALKGRVHAKAAADRAESSTKH
jgi:hypothetical protein